MAYTIKHRFTSGKADATDSTLVRPTAWNDDHDLQMSEGVIIGRPPGSGTGPGQEIPLSSLYMPGMVVMWVSVTPPNGWLLCQGQSLLRADYPNLFAIIGGQYGAADASHFSLPDMRGRVPAGVDGTGRLTTATVPNAHLLGAAGGQETEQAYADVNVSTSGRSYGATGGEALSVHLQGNVNYSGDGWGGANGGGPLHGNHYHSVDMWTQTSGNQSCWADGTYSGSGGGYTRAVSNVQPTITINYMIKT